MFSISLLLAAALVFAPEDAHRAYETARRLVDECTPRDAGTIRGRIASNQILDEASAVGADVRRDPFEVQTYHGTKTLCNLYAPFKCNETSRWVVVVSHYDTKPGVKCPGANDGASTTGLLVSFANVLSSWRNPKGNVMLVWTDGEECALSYSDHDGLHGSRRAVEYLKEKGYPIQAVICVDMLGDKDLNISVPTNGTPTLQKIAVHAARRAGYPDLVSPLSESVTDDHVPFLNAGYSAIDLIDFQYGSEKGLNDYWHTAEDTMKNVSEESLLKSGRILAEMIDILL